MPNKQAISTGRFQTQDIVERQHVIERLRRYSHDIRDLMDLIGDRSYLPCEEKAKAQELMKSLKQRLVQDYKRGDTVRGWEALNAYEKAYFHPAVCGASSQIRVRWNSDPARSRWHGELYAAHIDIDYSLHNLENRGTS